jgi:hypothetical protein
MLAARVVAADDSSHTADPPGHDRVVERPEGSPVRAAQHVIDVLVRKAGDQILAYVWDLSSAPVLVIVDGILQDLFGDRSKLCARRTRRETAPLSLTFGRSGDDFGVEILRQAKPAPA